MYVFRGDLNGINYNITKCLTHRENQEFKTFTLKNLDIEHKNEKFKKQLRICVLKARMSNIFHFIRQDVQSSAA